MRTALFLAFVAIVSAQRQWVVQRPNLATILLGISFSDEDFGIVTGGADGVGGVILLTRDGGETYSRVPLQGPGGPPAIAMYLNAQLAFPGTVSAAAGLCSWCFESSGVEYTTDMERYQLANIPPQGFPPVVAVQGGAHVKGLRHPQHFGFVGMWGITSLDPQVADTGIRHSRDSGLVWERVSIPNQNIRYLSMPSSSVWYVTAGSWPRKFNKEDGVQQLSEKMSVRTSNLTNLSIEFSEEFVGTAASRRLNQLDGYRAEILKTTDMGATWSVVYSDNDNGWYPNNLDCVDINVCIAVGDGSRGVAMRTIDGGRTWTQVWTRPGANTMAMDVRMVNARDGFLAWGQLSQVAFTGQISQTTDGGLTWTDSTVQGSVVPVSLSVYTRRDGTLGGHGTGLNPQGQSSTIKYM